MKKGIILSFSILLLLAGLYVVCDKLSVISNAPNIEQKVVDNQENRTYYVYLNMLSYEMDSIAICEEHKRETAPYCLITSYKDTSYADYGTYREIDSLKCIRYAQMMDKAKSIDSAINFEAFEMKKKADELKALNTPCTN